MNLYRLSRCLAMAVVAGGFGIMGQANESPIEPLRIIQTTLPQFPARGESLKVSQGEARILISVNSDGQLADCLVLGYTLPAFADEAMHALKAWRYEPARLNGAPMDVRVPVTFTFHAEGKVLSLLSFEFANAFITHVQGPRFISRVCRPRDLDRPLQALQQTAPRRPGKLRGRVLADFYVDESGCPRMPVVANSADPALAREAVHAVEQWRFVPPRRWGHPAIVHVRQEFVFAD